MKQFRKHLVEKVQKSYTTYDELFVPIKNGELTEPSLLWNNHDLVMCKPTTGRVANVIFPESVNLLTTSIFFDRIYVQLFNFDNNSPFPLNWDEIESEAHFRRKYQMNPADFLELVKIEKVVPIFGPSIERCSDYLLKEIYFPLITNDMPYITFEGQGLICNLWQVKHNALPDPKQKDTWGFLMEV